MTTELYKTINNRVVCRDEDFAYLSTEGQGLFKQANHSVLVSLQLGNPGTANPECCMMQDARKGLLVFI